MIEGRIDDWPPWLARICSALEAGKVTKIDQFVTIRQIASIFAGD